MISITCDTVERKFVQDMLESSGYVYSVEELCGGYRFSVKKNNTSIFKSSVTTACRR